MKVYVGFDLGSTTTKAVVMGPDQRILGKGITNSRSNYDTAVAVARSEAFIDTSFSLLQHKLDEGRAKSVDHDVFVDSLERAFRQQQYLNQLEQLATLSLQEAAGERYSGRGGDLQARLDELFRGMAQQAPELFAPDSAKRSHFFRDIAGSQYMHLAEQLADPAAVSLELLVGIFDKCIIQVENMVLDLTFESNIGKALDRAFGELPDIPEIEREQVRRAAREVVETELDETGHVGTGYGRVRLPFPKESIRSEILCHGLGAHYMYPRTATVLDIGGQDTKAIQVDSEGIVTSFQMNDRCAAGCGRYLGYIADELNMGVQELGPLAMEAQKNVRINSTCTVFAGAELRERLNNGERREDILKGLHRSIIVRAMSLLARSGGVFEEFTFTGGVANNEAAVAALRDLIYENYGERTINISPNSIYTGAIGAALFAMRGDHAEQAA